MQRWGWRNRMAAALERPAPGRGQRGERIWLGCDHPASPNDLDCDSRLSIVGALPQVGKFRELLDEGELEGTGGAVALLAYDDLGHAAVFF